MPRQISGSEMTGRIIAVIDALARRSGQRQQHWGVRELAAEMDASRSTINRVLQGLTETGFAQSIADRSYTAGPRLCVLASIIQRRHPVFSRADPVIKSLAEDTDATVLLAVQAAPSPEAFIASVRQRPGPVRYSVLPGDHLPLYAGAAGRAILGQLDIAALDDIKLVPLTDETVVDTNALAGLIENDRRRGYAVSVGQLYSAAAGVAAPLQIQGLHAAISVTRPRQITDEQSLERNGQRAQAAAATLQTKCDASLGTPESGGVRLPPGSSAVQRLCRLVTIIASRPHGVAVDKALPPWLGATSATTTALLSRADQLGLILVTDAVARPGPLLLKWAAALGPHAPVAEVAQALLHELGARTGETVGLAEYSEGTRHARMTAVVPGPRPMDYSLAADVDIPLHAGAAGKAILAYCDDETLKQQELHPLTDTTIRSKNVLCEQLELIRHRGYATGEGERIPDAFGISAPYFNSGAVAGSVTVTIPNSRLDRDDIEALAADVMSISSRITNLISP